MVMENLMLSYLIFFFVCQGLNQLDYLISLLSNLVTADLHMHTNQCTFKVE